MVELQSIFELWEKAKNAGHECVLATVVKTQGSSYRLPGARLLLTPDGERAGSISGGCLEDDLVKRAFWFTENGPMIRRYDTTPDGELTTEYGLGCNGIIHVLLERLTAENCRIVDVLRKVRETRQAAAVTHVIAPKHLVGTRFGDHQNAAAEGVFLEQLVPPLRLLICGAGDDAIPLYRLALFLGWPVSIYDGRAHYARADRFPGALNVVVWQPGMDLPFQHDPWTVAVLMTHSYSQDLAFLQQMIKLQLPYLGLLGPQKRTLQLLEETGLALSEHPELHAPMGLDIGADGPEQVALSVVAEIQATLNRRNGGQLRNRLGSIHADEHAGGGNAQKDAYTPSLTCV